MCCESCQAVREAARNVCDSALDMGHYHRAVPEDFDALREALAQPCGVPQPSEAAIEAIQQAMTLELPAGTLLFVPGEPNFRPSRELIIRAWKAAYAADHAGAPGGGPQDRT
jgi:hypothetical protein